MSSIKDKMKVLPRIKLDTDKNRQVVIEISHGNILVCEKIVSLDSIQSWNPTTGKSKVVIEFNTPPF